VLLKRNVYENVFINKPECRAGVPYDGFWSLAQAACAALTQQGFMTKKASVHDVAKAAGVSIGSVSRVLNGGTYVSADLRERVLAAVEKLGYRPDANAKNLRTGSSKTIGCLIPDISNPLYASYVSVIESRLQESGYMLLLGNSRGNTTREQELMQLFVSRGMDGIIATPLKESGTEADVYAKCRIPLVILDRDLKKTELDTIAADHRAGIKKTVEYLFSLGHERIALFTPGLDIRPGRERVAGYTDAYEAAKRKIDPRLVREINPRLVSSFDEMKALLESPAPPTALIGLGTQVLSGAMRAAHEMGLVIPTDLSVVGIGTPATLEFAQPPMTMLRFDIEASGRAAAELILDRIQSGNTKPARRITKPMELIIASSCAIRRTERR